MASDKYLTYFHQKIMWEYQKYLLNVKFYIQFITYKKISNVSSLHKIYELQKYIRTKEAVFYISYKILSDIAMLFDLQN